MGDSRALPGFGHVDLALGDDGELDLDFGELNDAPASSSRPAAQRARDAVAAIPGSEDATRIVSGDPLSNVTRSAPPPPGPTEVATRLGSLERELLALVEAEEASSPSSPSAPSGSGIATRDARVAEMRELYARGDAEGALALAQRISTMPPPVRSADSPDASIYVEYGEAEISLDPFGGLVPVEDDDVPSERPMPPSGAPAPVLLTLTARQAIPRLLKGMNEIASLPIDHRAGFLLGHMDGMHTMEEILDICAMPPEEALALIKELEQMGVVAVD